MTVLNGCSIWTEKNRPTFIVGPTATGKTAAAIQLALNTKVGRFSEGCGEIVNADSVQVYRGLDIGAAKPDMEERQGVPFHLLDLVTADQPYTAADWKADAQEAIEGILRRGGHPIVCGGTGMYVKALLDDWSMAATPADPAVRAELIDDIAREGSSALHARLQKVDSETARRLHPNDAVRIIRAMEVYRLTGKPLSDHQEEDRNRRRARPALRIGLNLPRAELYARIDRRVDRMVEQGFVAEVEGLLSKGFAPGLGALGSLGYKEIGSYLTGSSDFPELSSAIEAIKLNTRRFAKRQQTWFKADQQIHWIDVVGLPPAEIAVQIHTIARTAREEQENMNAAE